MIFDFTLGKLVYPDYIRAFTL